MLVSMLADSRKLFAAGRKMTKQVKVKSERAKLVNTDQRVFLPVPASPLTSSTPNSYISAMMRLSQSYLQNRDVSYLGHAVRAIRPLGGHAVAKMGVKVYDEMVATDPQVAQGVDVIQMAATSNELKFSSAIESNNEDEQELGNGGAGFIEEMFNQMDCDHNEERQKAVFDLVQRGDGFLELEFKSGRHELEGYMTIDSWHAVDAEDVIIITDSFNRIIGYAPYGFPGVTAPLDSWVPADSYITYLFDAYETVEKREEALADVKILPKWKVCHFRWQPRSNNPRGRSLLDAASQPWWAKQQIMSVLLGFVEEFGIPRKTGTVSEKAEAVCLYDAKGNPVINAATGQPVEQDPLPNLLGAMYDSPSGGNIALPNGYNLSILEANPQMLEAIIKALDFFNIEISKAILKQHLASSEGQRGSEKGADSHGDILSLLILYCKSIQRRTIQQIIKSLLVSNFGRENRRYTPNVDIGDADGLPVTLSEIGFLTQANYFAPSQFSDLDRRMGFKVRKPGEVPGGAEGQKLQGMMADKTAGRQATNGRQPSSSS